MTLSSVHLTLSPTPHSSLTLLKSYWSHNFLTDFAHTVPSLQNAFSRELYVSLLQISLSPLHLLHVKLQQLHTHTVLFSLIFLLRTQQPRNIIEFIHFVYCLFLSTGNTGWQTFPILSILDFPGTCSLLQLFNCCWKKKS